MKKLLAIGEALIDFIPSEKSKAIKNVAAFYPNVGGAPANVCGAFVKLGGSAQMITQLGNDPFGDKIIEEFNKYNIGHSYVLRTDEANTSLAFVALNEKGNREFSFYRNPGADMLLSPESIREEWFNDGYCLHFCSVSLGDFPMMEAHKRAIDIAHNKNMIVSFDPNIRLPLWKDKNKLRERVLEFMALAHIVKISDEEIEFITGKKSVEEAKELLFRGNTKVIVYTKGADGAEVHRLNGSGYSACEDVEAVDTTGAGDAFIGSYLYKLYENNIGVEDLESVPIGILVKALDFSNRFSTISITRKGAIASYPDNFKEV